MTPVRPPLAVGRESGRLIGLVLVGLVKHGVASRTVRPFAIREGGRYRIRDRVCSEGPVGRQRIANHDPRETLHIVHDRRAVTTCLWPLKPLARLLVCSVP